MVAKNSRALAVRRLVPRGPQAGRRYSTWGRGLFGRLGLLSDAERDRLKKDLVSLLFLQARARVSCECRHRRGSAAVSQTALIY